MFSMLTHTDLDCFRRGVAPASEGFGNWSVSVFASWRPAARSSTSVCIPVLSTRSPNDYPMTVCDCILPAAKPGGWHRPRSPATPSGTGSACTMSLEHLLTVVLHADTSLNAVLDGGRRAPRGPGPAAGATALPCSPTPLRPRAWARWVGSRPALVDYRSRGRTTPSWVRNSLASRRTARCWTRSSRS